MALILINIAAAIPINYINVNESECKPAIMRLEDLGLLEGISSITIYQPNINIGPWQAYRFDSTSFMLWFPRKIVIRSGCDIGTLLHEIAHNEQKKAGISLRQARLHDSDFTSRLEYVKEVFNDEGNSTAT